MTKKFNFIWVKYVITFFLFFILIADRAYAVQIEISADKTTVDEGGQVKVTVKFTQQEGEYIPESIIPPTSDFSQTIPGVTYPASSCGIELSWAPNNGSAELGNNLDYTVDDIKPLRYTATSHGATSETIITYTINANDGFEPDETFSGIFAGPIKQTGDFDCGIVPKTSPLIWPVITIKDTELPKEITPDFDQSQNMVNEGAGTIEIGSVGFDLPTDISFGENCTASVQVRVDETLSSAKSADFELLDNQILNFDKSGSSNPTGININVKNNILDNADKVIVLDAEYKITGGSSCKLGIGPTKITKMIDIKHTPQKSIVPSFTVVQNSVKEGSGPTYVADISLSLPSGQTANSACAVKTIVKDTTSGNADPGTDYNFNEMIINYGTGDPDTKTVPINLDVLAGKAGDGPKTVELEATFDDSSSGNSCKLADKTPQKIAITINDDIFEEPSFEITSNKSSVKEGETINIKIARTGVSSPRNIAARDIGSCDMSAKLSFPGGTATAEDVTFTQPGINNFETTPVLNIPLTIISDTVLNEGNETLIVKVTLSGNGSNDSSCLTIPTATAQSSAITIENTITAQRVQQPEELRTSTCSVMSNQILSGDKLSFFNSNCIDRNVEKDRDRDRNFEPEEISAQTNAVLGAAERQLKNVRSRLDKLKSSRGQRGVDVSGVNIGVQGTSFSLGMLGGGGGEENDLLQNSRWSIFANGEVAFGENNRGFDKTVSTGDRNFDFNSKGLTIGADYRFPGEKLIAGGALGYKDFDADFTSQEGNTNTTGINISMYGTYLLSDKAYLDGVIGLGKDSIKSRRPVNNDGQGGIGDQTTFAIGNPDAQEITFSLGGGYEISKREWTFNPYGRLDYTKGTIDKYRETASHDSARTSMFEIDKQSIESLTSSLGLKASKVYSTSKGVLIPFASLEWKHEFKGRGSISGQSIFLQENPDLGLSSEFSETNVDDTDKNYYNIGAGVSAVFPKGRSAFFNIESRLGDSTIKDNVIRAGYRWEF